MTNHNTGPGARTPLGQHFFNWVRSLDVRRGDNRWIGGVCSGVARRVGWDPLLVRIIWFASLFVGGVGLAAYGIAWMLLPDERDGTIPVEELTRGRCTGSFVMATIFVIIGLPITTGTLPVLALALVGALIFAVIAGSRSDATWAPAGAQQSGASQPSSNSWAAPASSSSGSSQGANTMYANNPYANPRGPQGNPYAQQPYQPYAQRPVPPTQPVRPAEVRRPAGPAIVGAMYGLVLIALAAAVLWQMVMPNDFVAGGGSVGMQLWVLGVTAVTGVVLVLLGIAGRRTGGLMPLAVIGLVLSLMVAGGAQIRTTVNGSGLLQVNGASGSDVAFSSVTYSSQDYVKYGLAHEGLDLSFSDATLDLSDWEQVTGEACPTDRLETDVVFSDLTIVLPQGCDYNTAGMTATFGSVIGLADTGSDGQDGSSSTGGTLTLAGDVTFGSVTVRSAGDGDWSGSSGSSPMTS